MSASSSRGIKIIYAYTALVKTLADSGALSMDDLFRNLAGARGALERVGETGAATLLGAMAASLQGV